MPFYLFMDLHKICTVFGCFSSQKSTFVPKSAPNLGHFGFIWDKSQVNWDKIHEIWDKFFKSGTPKSRYINVYRGFFIICPN